MEEDTLSNHMYVYYTLDAGATPAAVIPQQDWAIHKLDKELCRETLACLAAWSQLSRNEDIADVRAGTVTKMFTAACSISILQRRITTKRQVYWWTNDIVALRRQCLTTRRKAQR